MTAVVKTRARLHARLEEAPGWDEAFRTAAHTDGAAGHDDEDAGFGVGRCHLRPRSPKNFYLRLLPPGIQ
jgi:hypothetical protein